MRHFKFVSVQSVICNKPLKRLEETVGETSITRLKSGVNEKTTYCTWLNSYLYFYRTEECLCEPADDWGQEKRTGKSDECKFPTHNADFEGESADGDERPASEKRDQRTNTSTAFCKAGDDGETGIRPARCESAGDAADKNTTHPRFMAYPPCYDILRQKGLYHPRYNISKAQHGQSFDYHRPG